MNRARFFSIHSSFECPFPVELYCRWCVETHHFLWSGLQRPALIVGQLFGTKRRLSVTINKKSHYAICCKNRKISLPLLRKTPKKMLKLMDPASMDPLQEDLGNI